MADYLVTDTELTSIANAIRTKGGTSANLSFPTGFVSAINAIPTGGGGSSKNIQMSMGRDEISSTSYVATDLTITVEKTGTYDCYWSMDRNTTSGTTGSRLYKNGTAVGSAHTSWTNSNGNNRNGKECEETLSLSAGDVLVVRARSRSTSYVCGVMNFIIVEQ